MLIVLTGCSGGGKSTLLDALAARGHLTVPEPGRRIVRAGGPMPWDDPAGFARACIAMSLADIAALPAGGGPVFLDRSYLDAVIWLQGQGLPVPPVAPAKAIDRAVLLPPWPEIRVLDAERRQPMAEAEAEYHALAAGYPAHGIATQVMPRASVDERLAWLLSHS